MSRYMSTTRNLDLSTLSEYSDPEPEMDQSQLAAILNEIFSVDAVSGFPKGDIAYFLSKDGNPQVKAWLESNLLSPRAKQTGTSIEGVTDDLIVEMSRLPGESNQAYSERLRGLYDSAKAEFERLNSVQS